MEDKKKIFFVGKTLSDKFVKNIEKHFHLVKSLSKRVSIIVYVPETKGSKTQLEKCKDWNLERMTYDDFCKKYVSESKVNSSDSNFMTSNNAKSNNYDTGVFDTSSDDDDNTSTAFKTVNDDNDLFENILFSNNKDNCMLEMRNLMYERHINMNMISIFKDNLRIYEEKQNQINNKLTIMSKKNEQFNKNT